MPSHAWHAARAAEKLAVHQAALPPEQRIVNRDDWDDVVHKKVAVLTRQAYENAKQAFITTASNPAVGICNSREEAEAYFQKHGTPFTNKVLRKFIETYAISHTGLIQEELSTRTIRSLAIYLFTAAKVAGNPVERDLQEATMTWLQGPMLSRGLVHRTEREKDVPLPQDITTFLGCLFDRRFMATLPTTRHTLLIALFVCLQVDCSSRVSELLRPSMSTENLVAYKIEHKEKIFRWSCVEVFAFKDKDTGPVLLQARLTFRSIKDLESKAYRKKTIPLRLLPTAFVAEDSLFWLMTLGLIDGVFEGVSSWSDIEHLQPGPSGQRIPVKNSMQGVPVSHLWTTSNRIHDGLTSTSSTQVFRAPNIYPSSQDDLISKEQMASQAMVMYLHRLSRFCGLEHSMLANVLRRGSAYILALSVTDEERCARMGHKETNTAYWTSYRNTTSTVDFQGLRHGIEQVNVSAMSSIFLDTDNDQPPDRVSGQGMWEIRRDEELLAILAEQSELADELVLKHGSLDSARAGDPERHQSYMQLRDKYSKKLSRLQDKKFKEEYKAYWAARKGRAQDSQQAAAEPPSPVVERSQDDVLLDELEKEIPDDDIPIDPQLLADEAEAVEAASALAADLDAGEAAGDFLDDVQQEDGAQAGGSSSPGGPSEGRSFAVREVGRYSLVDHVPTYLYDQPHGTTWGELSAILVTTFNHLHPADKFFPNEEPFPGTYECRFCGLEFYNERRVQVHSHLCEGERLARDTLDQLQDGDAGAVDTCPLMHLKKDGITLYPCWFKLRGTWAPFRDHVNHYHREQGDVSEDSYLCRGHGAPLAFGSLQDFRTHVVTAHNAPTSILKWKRPAGSLALEELVFFCPFCQVWIPRAEVLEETHLATHINDAVAVVSARGLSGTFTALLWVHPSFCPFCLYDTTLSVVTRFHQFGDTRAFLAHVAAHLNKVKGTATCPAAVSTPVGLPQCPNSESLDAAGLAAHLREAHDLNVKVPAKKATAKKATVKEATAKKVTAKKAPAEKAVVEESSESEDVQVRKRTKARVVLSSDSDDVQPKKRTKATGRQPLGEIDINQQANH